MERQLPRPMPEDRCLIEIAWTLAGCRQRWAADFRYVSASLPADAVGRTAGYTARALRAEQTAGEEYRARMAFGLPR